MVSKRKGEQMKRFTSGEGEKNEKGERVHKQGEKGAKGRKGEQVNMS